MRLRFNGHPARRSREHSLRYPAAGCRRASTCSAVSQSTVAGDKTIVSQPSGSGGGVERSSTTRPSRSRGIFGRV